VLQDLRAIQCWPLWTRLALMWAGLGAAYLLQIPPERDWPGEPFLLFVLVVIGTTLCFGTRLGLISAALSAFLSVYFFEPVGSPTLRYASDFNKIALYAIIAFGCVVGFTHLTDTLIDKSNPGNNRSISLREIVQGVANNFVAIAALIKTESSTKTKPILDDAGENGLCREAIQVLPAAIYMTDAKGCITFYNEAAAALWGCRPELGDSKFCGSWKLYWPDGTPLPHDECPMAMALHQKRPIRDMAAVAERSDGTRIPFIPHPTPLFDESGKLTGAVNMLVDISEHKQAERDRQQLAAIVASSEDAIISKDLNGIVTSWNRRAELMFGYTAEEMVGKSITTLIPAGRHNEEPEILGRIRRGERMEHYETVRQHKDGTLVDISLSVSPVMDAGGRVVGASKIARDITYHKQAKQALAERNAQLALAGRAALVGSYAYDVIKGTMQVSVGYAVIHGLPEGTTETSYSEWRTRVHPEDLGRAEGLRNQAFADRRNEDNAEYRIVLTSGEVRWIERRGTVSYGEDGRAGRVVGVDIDVTERRRMEQALTDRNGQLELAGKAALVGRFAIEIEAAREDFTSHRMHFSPGFAAIYGLPEETVEISVGDWRSLVHPDDLPQFVEHRQQLFAERRGEHHAEFRIVRPCGTIRWIEARSFIEYDQAGHAKRLVGVNIDITERKRAEEARKILNAELDHRVKNALSTVSAVVSHTKQASGSVADFVAALDGRIRSMATTHELLTSHRWHGVLLMELVQRELAPYATRNNTEINGPGILLKPEAGQAMAMVLHELATNAAKYGALSTKNGRVSIRWHWHLNGHPHSQLAFEWQEIGGPPVVAVGKSSYGTSTIRDLIPYEFGGTVDLVFAPEGVRCRLELPSDWLGNDHQPLSETGAHALPRTGEV
jgi:PAS domain S-box-containing protein